jgi:PAS domain S-box-containing protein
MNDEAKAGDRSALDEPWDLESRFQAILENTSDIIYSCDIKGNLTFINKAAEKYTGYSVAELLKMNIRDLIAPDHRWQVDDALGNNTGSDSTLVVDIVCKDGRRVPWEMKSWFGSQGEPSAAIQGIARDVSHRRSIEMELEESEQRYKNLVESSKGLICTHDLEGVLLSVNQTAADSLGYTVDELVGKNLRDFLVPSVKARFSDYLRAVIANREHSGLLRGLRKDGDEVVWFYFNTLSSVPAKQPYILGHAQDVTELVIGSDDRDLLIEKLQKALRQVKALTGMIPICSSCKNIRDVRGDWKKVERFFSENSEVEFSHAICPECAKALYPTLYDRIYPAGQ